MENIDGVSCIKGEIHSIMTLMRLSTRWSNAKNTRSTQLEESPFVNSYRRLNEYLEGLFDLSEVDCVKYLTPFHEVIVSDQASGPLTSAALSSVCKFAMFGFLSTKNPRSEQGISLVAQCISKCIFEETDWESDEVILMKLLELSTLTLRCDASKLLSVSAAWDIYSTCLSIHNQYRASKILRSEAETALRHLTQSTFSRAHNLLKLSDETTSPSTQFDEIDLANRSWDAVSQTYTFDGTVGVTLLLCNIMSVLSNLMNLQTENAVRVKFSLSLVNIALEAGGPTLSLMLPLVDILKGDVSRHLLRATQSEDLEIFSLALRVVFNLFMSIKNHMKVQLEVFLTSIHLRLLQHHQSTFLGQAKQELTLESLLEFCREPSLMQDLYTNYDCDVQCTNLFDAIITVLCERCQPQRAIRSDVDTSNGLPSEVDVNGKATITNRLALAGVSSILHAVATKCRKAKSQANEFYPRESTRASTATFFDLSSTTPPPPLLSRESTGQIQDDPVYSENLRKLEAVYRSSGDDGAMSQSESEGDFVGLNVSQSAEFRALRKQDDFGIANSVGTSSPASSNSSFRLPDKAVNLSMVSIYGEESEIAESSFAANSVEVLRQRKLRKQRLLHTAELFNEKPLKLEWVRFAIDQQLIDPYKEGTDVADIDEAYPADAKSLALFLKNTPGLGKTEIGEYLSKGPADKYPFHVSVLREYVNTFDFTGKDASFVKALRTFLGHFRLPGEAQCIDRLMEAFARKLFEDLGVGKPFASADAAYVLAFSTIMLQTDLHNPNVTHKRMSKEEFIRNNRGINDGDSLPKEYLEALYDEIKARKIEVDIDMNDNNELMQAFNLTDTNSWNKLINKNAAYQAPAAFTSTTAARRGAKDYTLTGFDPSASLHQKDMFLVMEERLLITIFALWQSCDDDSIISKTYQMLWDYVTICIDLQLTTLFNELVQTCAMKAKNILESSRKLTHNSRLQNKAVSNTFYQKLWSLEHEYGKHDLSRLLKASVEDLVATGNRGDIVSSEQVNWIGVSLVKGEIMIKFVLSVAATFFHDIDKTSSSTLLCFLIWIRGRGALPQSLAELSHSWVFQSREGSVDFSRFQPSLFSMMSHRRARGMKGRGASPSKQASSGSLLQSLGSLLFAPIPESESRGRKGESNLTPVDSDDLAAEQLKLDLNSCEYSHRLSRGNGENINMDRLLDIAISETPFQNVFGPNSKEMFGDMKNYDDTTGLLLEVFSTLAVNLLEESKSSNAQDIQLELTFPEKVSIRSHTREKTPAKEFSTSASRKEKEIRGLKEMVDHVTEMDVIFFAELITRITFKDPKKLWKYWNKIHGTSLIILTIYFGTSLKLILIYSLFLFVRCAATHPRGRNRHRMSKVSVIGRAYGSVCIALCLRDDSISP